MKTERALTKLEERLMEDMVKDIGGSNDPVDAFKAIERYREFCKARTTRLEGESLIDETT